MTEADHKPDIRSWMPWLPPDDSDDEEAEADEWIRQSMLERMNAS